MISKRKVKVFIGTVWWFGNRLADLIGLGSSRSGALTVLYYHAVRAADASKFELQLEAIRAYADIVEPDYLGEASGPPKVPITFDDAFVRVIVNALPPLEARKMSSTIFVPSSCLGRRPSCKMEHDAMDHDEIVASADEVRALANRGLRIGAHSRTHPRLTSLAPSEAAHELSGSKADLESLLGAPVEIFAFPYGDFNAPLVETAKEAGYPFVFSTEPCRVDPQDTRILRPRVSVNPTDSPLEFWLKLRGGYEWMPAVSLLKRRFLSKLA